jgi:hypothetical protein
MTLVSVRVPLVVAVLLAGWCGVARAGDGRTDKERQLIVQLRTAAEGEKAIACKQLAIHGSADAVPDVAKLLGDERLSSWARIALEAIPDPACDAALREAAGRRAARCRRRGHARRPAGRPRSGRGLRGGHRPRAGR